MQATLWVMAGGAAGAALRYWLGRAAFAFFGPGWPWGTFGANLIGGLAMGLLAGWLARHGTGGETARLLLGVGVLGGFTTFSAYSLEVALMLQRGEYAMGAIYAIGSVVGAVAALFMGLGLMRGLA